MTAGDPALSLDPFPWYRTMREGQPVFQDPRDGAWHVFRYGDVQRVLTEHAAFSSDFGRGRGARADRPLDASLVTTDPPRHRQLRALVSQAFTPRAIAALEPRIARIADGLLDRAAPAGRLDLIEDFASPLPVIVIAELLGIPPEDRARFRRWSDAIVTTGAGASAAGAAAQGEMAAYFGALLARRRQEPRDDLISELLAARIDGQHLSEVEVLGFCVLLLVAGNETTTNLLGNAVLCLDEHPTIAGRLRAAPGLLPALIEEVLRYRSPVQAMFRIATADTPLGDRTIPAGGRVVAWIGAANRDPEQFPAPDRFDPARQPNRHLAFGHGVHFCLGAPLARLEARLALAALLARLPDLRRAPAVPLERLESFIVYGVRRLPVTFSPAPRTT